MKQTKILIAEVVIASFSEAKYVDKDVFTYACTDGSIFKSVTRFAIGDTVRVYIVKFKGNLALSYSLKE